MKIVAETIGVGRIVNDIRFVELLAVDVNLGIGNTDAVAGKANGALDVVRVIVEGKFEDDDVTAANVAVGEEFFVGVAATFEDEFIDQEIVADQESFLHGAGGNFKGLDDEGGAEEDDENGDEERFGVFAERAGSWPLFVVGYGLGIGGLYVQKHEPLFLHGCFGE